MTRTVLQIAAWSGTVALMFTPSPQMWVLGGILITTLGQIIQTRMKYRDEEKGREMARKDRAAHTEELRLEIHVMAGRLRGDIAENTLLTLETGQKAEVALAAANGVNMKIAQIAAGIEETAVDTNETIHRLVSKLPAVD